MTVLTTPGGDTLGLVARVIARMVKRELGVPTVSVHISTA